MKIQKMYEPDDKLINIIGDNYNILQALGCFGIMEYERIMPGGKGINVSYVLNILKQDNLALGFVGGLTGAEIERLMDKDGIRHDFVHLKHGNSRIDVQMLDEIGRAHV